MVDKKMVLNQEIYRTKRPVETANAIRESNRVSTRPYMGRKKYYRR
jgi:hypothetical protein